VSNENTLDEWMRMAVVLNRFSLRRLRKSLLDLRRTSHKMLIAIKVLLIDETTKRNMHQYCDAWTCLFLQRLSNPGRFCETATSISLPRLIRDRYLVL